MSRARFSFLLSALLMALGLHLDSVWLGFLAGSAFHTALCWYVYARLKGL